MRQGKTSGLQPAPPKTLPCRRPPPRPAHAPLSATMPTPILLALLSMPRHRSRVWARLGAGGVGDDAMARRRRSPECGRGGGGMVAGGKNGVRRDRGRDAPASSGRCHGGGSRGDGRLLCVHVRTRVHGHAREPDVGGARMFRFLEKYLVFGDDLFIMIRRGPPWRRAAAAASTRHRGRALLSTPSPCRELPSSAPCRCRRRTFHLLPVDRRHGAVVGTLLCLFGALPHSPCSPQRGHPAPPSGARRPLAGRRRLPPAATCHRRRARRVARWVPLPPKRILTADPRHPLCRSRDAW